MNHPTVLEHLLGGCPSDVLARLLIGDFHIRFEVDSRRLANRKCELPVSSVLDLNRVHEFRPIPRVGGEVVYFLAILGDRVANAHTALVRALKIADTAIQQISTGGPKSGAKPATPPNSESGKGAAGG